MSKREETELVPMPRLSFGGVFVGGGFLFSLCGAMK